MNGKKTASCLVTDAETVADPKMKKAKSFFANTIAKATVVKRSMRLLGEGW